MSKNTILFPISFDVETISFLEHFSDSGSSDGDTLSKKMEAKKAETAVSSKEKVVDPVVEPSNPKKRPAGEMKDKQAKKPKKGEALIPQRELPVPPTSTGVHIELHQDVSFISSFFLHRLRLLLFF